MKRFVCILLFAVMVMALFVGCGSASMDTSAKTESTQAPATKQAEAAKPTEAKKEIVIGSTYLNISNEYIKLLSQGVETKSKELGVKVIILDGEASADKQNQQVESLIAQKVDAIIFNPIELEGCSPAVEKAKAAKIPIINVCTGTKAEPDAYVGSDDTEAAKIAIDYIAKRLGGKGNMLMMQGILGQSSEVLRTKGATDTLKNYPDIKVMATQSGKWDRSGAMGLMENWIQANKGNFKAVFAQNDEMAMGALKALEDAKIKNDVVVIGVDGIADAKKAVKDGRLDATVFQDAKGQGAKAVEVAMMAIKGEKLEKQYIIPFQLITKDNVDNFLK